MNLIQPRPAPTSPPPPMPVEEICACILGMYEVVHADKESVTIAVTVDNEPRTWIVDAGLRIQMEGEPSTDCIRALINIAREKGWESISVEGEEAFRRKVADWVWSGQLALADQDLREYITTSERKEKWRDIRQALVILPLIIGVVLGFVFVVTFPAISWLVPLVREQPLYGLAVIALVILMVGLSARWLKGSW